MPPLNRESDPSFAVFPAPNVARPMPSGHHSSFPQISQSHPESRFEDILVEIKYRYDLLARENASLARINEFLTSYLCQRDEQENAALQMSHHKDQDLQEARRRIQELERMVNPLKSIMAQMQNRESRLKACEHQMSNLKHLFEELNKTMRYRNGASLLSEEQSGVHELAQSVNGLEFGTASKSVDQ
ncbi:hypothetical protein N7476_000285 [Penicillium atrosanguineum]|uniref:Uncharacterized protein n=1 Tax=Penicillium atrosanguineum TaxID=1132637 RepID=A0A9W9QGC8_9EURO|nr:hypothetical protein N7476_000285 [Penicillium atrosanguineum]